MSTEPQLRCVHVLKNAMPEYAAICRLVLTLARHLGGRGFRTSVICLGEGGPMAEEMMAAGATVQVVRWTGARSDLALAGGFYSGLRELRPDIVHVHHGGLTVRLLARMAGARTVVQQVHSRILESDGRGIERVSFCGADAVIAGSVAIAACLHATAVETIYPGVECAPQALPLHTGERLLLGFAGRLVALKGVDILLRAVALLHANGSEVRLQIAGNGPEEDSLRRLAKELRVSDAVEFVGWRRKLGELRERWDVAVIPSREEGFGLAALEAMAVGRTVIASRVGGLPELVEDSVTGILASPGDADELARAIARLGTNRELLATMGAAAWRRATMRFSAERMASDVAALYAQLLERKPAAQAADA